MKFPAVLVLTLIGAAIPMASADGQEPPPQKEPQYPSGETLVLEARLLKAPEALAGALGRVVVSCRKAKLHSKDVIRYRAVAKGKAFGLELNQEMESIIRPETGAPITHSSIQRGSAIAQKRIDFEEGKAEYWKMKHCKNEDGECEAAHFADGDPEKGHCTDRHCGRMEHRTWSLRETLELDQVTHDPLSVILAGRMSDIGLDHPEVKYRVLADRHLWEILVRAEEGGEITTPAGTFDCLRLSLEPRHLNPKPGHPGGEFEGPFGLQGDIQIWVDKEERRPIRIRGKIPLGALLEVEIQLAEIRQNESEADVKEGSSGADTPKGGDS